MEFLYGILRRIFSPFFRKKALLAQTWIREYFFSVNFVKAFSDESDNWIGKQVRAWKTKSEKAKAGYVFVFVPTDWVRNDIGEWEDAKGNKIDIEEVKKEVKPKDEDTIEYPEDEINPDDIPF